MNRGLVLLISGTAILRHSTALAAEVPTCAETWEKMAGQGDLPLHAWNLVPTAGFIPDSAPDQVTRQGDMFVAWTDGVDGCTQAQLDPSLPGLSPARSPTGPCPPSNYPGRWSSGGTAGSFRAPNPALDTEFAVEWPDRQLCEFSRIFERRGAPRRREVLRWTSVGLPPSAPDVLWWMVTRETGPAGSGWLLRVKREGCQSTWLDPSDTVAPSPHEPAPADLAPLFGAAAAAWLPEVGAVAVAPHTPSSYPQLVFTPSARQALHHDRVPWRRFDLIGGFWTEPNTPTATPTGGHFYWHTCDPGEDHCTPLGSPNPRSTQEDGVNPTLIALGDGDALAFIPGALPEQGPAPRVRAWRITWDGLPACLAHHTRLDEPATSEPDRPHLPWSLTLPDSGLWPSLPNSILVARASIPARSTPWRVIQIDDRPVGPSETSTVVTSYLPEQQEIRWVTPTVDPHGTPGAPLYRSAPTRVVSLDPLLLMVVLLLVGGPPLWGCGQFDARHRAELRTQFVSFLPTTRQGAAMFGRSDLVRTGVRAILAGRDLLIDGPTRSGKTMVATAIVGSLEWISGRPPARLVSPLQRELVWTVRAWLAPMLRTRLAALMGRGRCARGLPTVFVIVTWAPTGEANEAAAWREVATATRAALRRALREPHMQKLVDAEDLRSRLTAVQGAVEQAHRFQVETLCSVLKANNICVVFHIEEVGSAFAGDWASKAVVSALLQMPTIRVIAEGPWLERKGILPDLRRSSPTATALSVPARLEKGPAREMVEELSSFAHRRLHRDSCEQLLLTCGWQPWILARAGYEVLARPHAPDVTTVKWAEIHAEVETARAAAVRILRHAQWTDADLRALDMQGWSESGQEGLSFKVASPTAPQSGATHADAGDSDQEVSPSKGGLAEIGVDLLSGLHHSYIIFHDTHQDDVREYLDDFAWLMRVPSPYLSRFWHARWRDIQTETYLTDDPMDSDAIRKTLIRNVIAPTTFDTLPLDSARLSKFLVDRFDRAWTDRLRAARREPDDPLREADSGALKELVPRLLESAPADVVRMLADGLATFAQKQGVDVTLMAIVADLHHLVRPEAPVHIRRLTDAIREWIDQNEAQPARLVLVGALSVDTHDRLGLEDASDSHGSTLLSRLLHRRL